LANLTVQRGLTHVEFLGRLRNRFSSSNERNGAQSKLGGEGTLHGGQPFIEGLFFTKIR
jgi:hypothetical protein